MWSKGHYQTRGLKWVPEAFPVPVDFHQNHPRDGSPRGPDLIQPAQAQRMKFRVFVDFPFNTHQQAVCFQSLDMFSQVGITSFTHDVLYFHN